MSAYLDMLRCADGSYYVGTGYTARRRPVTIVFHEHFDPVTDAIAAERQVKGWRRDKEEALIRGDYAALRELSTAYEKRCITNMRPSTSSG